MADIWIAPSDIFLGLDPGLSDFETFFDWSLLQEPVMTTDPLLRLSSNAVCDDRLNVHTCSLESPRHQSQSSHPPSEAARSPGMTGGIYRSARSTAASSSRSPASLILTPASTLADYSADLPASDSGRQEDSDHLVVSPIDHISPFTDDSVYARHFGGDDPQSMNPNHSRLHYGRAQTSSYHDHGSTSAPHNASSQHSQHSRASSVAPSDGASFAQQASFSATAATSGAWIDQAQTAHYHNYFADSSATYALPDSTIPAHGYSQDVISNADADHLFRAFSPNTTFTPDQIQAWNQDWFQYQAQAGPQVPNLSYQQPRFSHHSSSSSRLDSPASSSLGTDTYRPHHRSEPAIVPSQALVHVPSPQPSQMPSRSTPSTVVPSQTPVPDSKPAGTPPGRPIKPAKAAARRSGAAGAAAASSSVAKRGGRQVNSHLQDSNRKKVSMMRKTGACWRCVLQRDPCPDEGTPCQRCFNRAEKGTLTFFECDRSKLPDLILDFLPPSLTFMHSKQAIEDTLKNEVVGWDKENSVDVYFTCGYGPALKWRLYEFRPRNQQLLGQLQYVRNATGKSTGTRKYSPPFGLTKIDTGDDQHFERYLDTLMEGALLRDFAWTCFEEETEIDDFQARVLDWLCMLYLDSGQDYDLNVLLRRIIRMMLITYIMGHTLTISEETLNGVLDSVKHSPRGTAAPFTSPRLANRQLKFYFSMIRNNLYVDVLNWLQQTLHSSGRKESTWLSSFCVILGISMVLEEIERTIFIQADAKTMNAEMSRDYAQTEAVNACERVDKRHSLLVGLFQCKYRDRSWKSGSFGQGTPELKNSKHAEHLQTLLAIVTEKQTHLEERKDVPLHEDTQCALTTRLVARFLLPFVHASPGR